MSSEKHRYQLDDLRAAVVKVQALCPQLYVSFEFSDHSNSSPTRSVPTVDYVVESLSSGQRVSSACPVVVTDLPLKIAQSIQFVLDNPEGDQLSALITIVRDCAVE